MVIFEIKQLNPETYRQQTRRSSFVVIITFAVLAMGLASLAVALLAQPDHDSLRLNIAGVVAGLLLTVVLVRRVYWHKPWMASARYGWQLKRSLMRITNVMHHVNAGVAQHDERSMKLLRFYHLGLTQMHELDGNTGSLSEMMGEIDRHRDAMQALGLDTEQNQLESEWLESVKRFAAK